MDGAADEFAFVAPEHDDDVLDREGEFLRAYANVNSQLARIAWQHCQDAAVVSDLVQTAVEKVYRKWHSRRGHKRIRNLEAYLVQTTRNETMNLHRVTTRERATIERLAMARDATRDAEFEADVSERELEALERAFAKLSERCQLLLKLHHMDGMPLRDVAQRLIMAEGTAKSGCSRCREQLLQLLTDEL